MPFTSRWNPHALPPQNDKVFLVTGASAGIGYFIAEQLAGTGAEIILAARSEARIGRAVQAIRGRIPDARLRPLQLDLTELRSIRAAAGTIGAGGRIDGVVLNAGVLAQPERRETADGHELVYGTNHLGNFALCALLYPALAGTPASRVVTMGSVGARIATLQLDDLESKLPPYRGFPVYTRSKLAQTVFALELDRRLRHAGAGTASIVAHPGGALDGLTPSRPPVHVRTTGGFLRDLPKAPIAQSKETAAWPAVRALLDPAAEGGQLWGPRLLRSKGKPILERPSPRMLARDVASRLWTASEEATGIDWPLGQ